MKIFQLYRFLAFISVATITVGCSKTLHVSDIDTSYYRIDEKVTEEDPQVTELIAPYKASLDEKMNEVIGQAAVEMTKDKPNSTLGNWFADAMLEEAGKIFEADLDIALQNYGGIRIPGIAAGDITVGKIYELMPFENFVVVMDLEGSVVQQLLNRIANYGGWPISHTLRFTIDDDYATNIFIKGEPLDLEKKYKVVLPDYTANGGDNCDFLIPFPKESRGVLLRDLLISHIKEKTANGKKIIADESQRINLLP